MTKDITQLLIVGAGRLAADVADMVPEHPDFALTGFIEGVDKARCKSGLRGLPIHWVEDAAPLAASHKLVTAIGDPRRRGTIEQLTAFGFEFATLIHPGAHVAPSAAVGPGTVVAPGAVIAADTRVGRHVYVNRGALIGHHCEIGEFCTVGPGVNIASGCRFGAGSYLGIGATVVDGITLGDGTFVAAGSLVTKSFPDGGRLAGAPARRMATPKN